MTQTHFARTTKSTIFCTVGNDHSPTCPFGPDDLLRVRSISSHGNSIPKKLACMWLCIQTVNSSCTPCKTSFETCNLMWHAYAYCNPLLLLRTRPSCCKIACCRCVSPAAATLDVHSQERPITAAAQRQGIVGLMLLVPRQGYSLAHD